MPTHPPPHTPSASRRAAPAAPAAPALLLVVVTAAAHLLVFSPCPSDACSTFLVGKKATADGSLFVTHSDDGEGNPDVRLSYIPAADHPPGSVRAVWPDLEDNPRYVGYARGETYHPSNVPPARVVPFTFHSLDELVHHSRHRPDAAMMHVYKRGMHACVPVRAVRSCIGGGERLETAFVRVKAALF